MAFEIGLFNNIKTNFALSGYTIKFGYGVIPANTVQPYIIQYSLDTNGDRATLCEDDDFTSGEAFIQWNIYTNNPTVGFYIKRELMKYIASLSHFTFNGDEYMIQLNQHSSSPSGVDENTGLFVEVVARELTYNEGS